MKKTRKLESFSDFRLKNEELSKVDGSRLVVTSGAGTMMIGGGLCSYSSDYEFDPGVITYVNIRAVSLN